MDNLNQPDFIQFDTDHTSLDHIDSVASTSVNTNTSTISQACDTSIDTYIIPVAESTPIKPSQPQTKDISTSPKIKHDITFSQSLSLPSDTPLSAQEERFTTYLVRRKLNADLKKQTITCKTWDSLYHFTKL